MGHNAHLNKYVPRLHLIVGTPHPLAGDHTDIPWTNLNHMDAKKIYVNYQSIQTAALCEEDV